MRLLPPQIPRNNPEVLDERFQIRSRLVTRQSKALRRQRRVEDALGLRRDLLSEIFKAIARTRAIVWRTQSSAAPIGSVQSVGSLVRRKGLPLRLSPGSLR